MKLTIEELPEFVRAACAAINRGAWQARHDDGVMAELGEQVNFSVEVVAAGGLNAIQRATSSQPNAPRITITQESGGGETQQVTPSAGRSSSETTSPTSQTDTTNGTDTITPAGRSSSETTSPTSQTDTTNGTDEVTPATRRTVAENGATLTRDETSQAGSRVVTTSEGAQTSQEVVTPASVQQIEQRRQGVDQQQTVNNFVRVDGNTTTPTL